MDKTFEVVRWMIYILLIAFCIGMLSGCSMFPTNPTTPDIIPDADQLVQVVKQTNWLATLSIIGIGAGFFSFLNGGTRGLQAMASCFVVLSIVLGVAKYSAWIAGIAMAGAVCLMAYTILMKNRAIKEVVKGGENLKMIAGGSNNPAIVQLCDIFKSAYGNQSPITKALVDNIQKSLGAK